MKVRAGIPFLIIVQGLGIWLMLSGLQALISPASSSLGSAWIWTLLLGLVCFFGSIVAGIYVFGQRSPY